MPYDAAAVQRILTAGGPNSAERQYALAEALGYEGPDLRTGALRGNPTDTPAWNYYILAGQMLSGAKVSAAPVAQRTGIATKVAYEIQSVQSFIGDHPIAVGATALGLAGAVGATVIATTRTKAGKRRKAGHRSPSTTGRSRRSGGRKPKFGSPAWRKRYMKGGRKAKAKPKARNKRGGAVRDSYKGRKVYRTKRGQPYILKANGQARFVKA